MLVLFLFLYFQESIFFFFFDVLKSFCLSIVIPNYRHFTSTPVTLILYNVMFLFFPYFQAPFSFRWSQPILRLYLSASPTYHHLTSTPVTLYNVMFFIFPYFQTLFSFRCSQAICSSTPAPVRIMSLLTRAQTPSINAQQFGLFVGWDPTLHTRTFSPPRSTASLRLSIRE